MIKLAGAYLCTPHLGVISNREHHHIFLGILEVSWFLSSKVSWFFNLICLLLESEKSVITKKDSNYICRFIMLHDLRNIVMMSLNLIIHLLLVLQDFYRQPRFMLRRWSRPSSMFIITIDCEFNNFTDSANV